MSNSRRHFHFATTSCFRSRSSSTSITNQPAIHHQPQRGHLSLESSTPLSPSSSQLQVVFVLAFSFLSSLTSSINQSPIINHHSSIINTCTHIHIQQQARGPQRGKGELLSTICTNRAMLSAPLKLTLTHTIPTATSY